METVYTLPTGLFERDALVKCAEGEAAANGVEDNLVFRGGEFAENPGSV